MKAIFIFISAFFLMTDCYSQNNINSVFKSLLVLNGTITLKENDSTKVSKIETLISNIDLDIEELKSEDFIPSFFYDYKVYKFNVDTNKITLKKDIPIIINFGLCTEYILIFNHSLNKYYRIKGFKNNDFNSFLDDLILYNQEKIKLKQILKDLQLLNFKDLDFNCLYEASKDSPNNRWKYPCMFICTDAKSSHLSR
jgi:hypothetical protein